MKRLFVTVSTGCVAVLMVKLVAATNSPTALRDSYTAHRVPCPNIDALSFFWGDGKEIPPQIGQPSSQREPSSRSSAFKGYEQSQVESLDQLRKRALAAIAREKRDVEGEFTCSINVAMSEGTCTVLLSKRQPQFTTYSVTFDAFGKILHLGGASGPHGEGSWARVFQDPSLGKTNSARRR